MINLPTFLKIKLRERKWTAYRLQKESGINRSTLSRILRGEIKKPSYESLKTLADVLGADIQELLVVSGQEKTSQSPTDHHEPQKIGKLTIQTIPIITPEKANGYDKTMHQFITQSTKEWLPTANKEKLLIAVKWEGSNFNFLTGDLLVVSPNHTPNDGDHILFKTKSGTPQIHKYHAQSEANALLISESKSQPYKEKAQDKIGVIIESIRRLT